MSVLTIDGAHGEGGGQVVRTALGLALVTRRPVAIENIRARRQKPGLQRQHLTAVRAAAEIGAAAVEGADLGSSRLVFRPTTVRHGAFRFAIGTAGSTSLVLQTVLPALWSAGGASTVELVGGTHNPMAPPFDFLARAFAPLLRRMGAGLELQLVRHGFYPAGGGVVRAAVSPAAWRTIVVERTVERPELGARIVNSRIPAHVPAREAATLAARLPLSADAVEIEEVHADGPGNAVMVAIAGPETTEVVTALAARGRRAEEVAADAAEQAQRLLAAGAPVGEHLADQLLLPMALAGGGELVTVDPTEHLRTNAWVVGRFLPVEVDVRPDGARWRVVVRPR